MILLERNELCTLQNWTSNFPKMGFVWIWLTFPPWVWRNPRMPGSLPRYVWSGSRLPTVIQPSFSSHGQIFQYIYIYNIILYYIYFNNIFGDILCYTWTWFNIVESCWILLLVKSTWNSPMGFLHQIPPSFSSSEARASRRARAWRLWITVFRVRRAGWGNPLFNGRMANGTIIPCGIIAMFDYQRRYIIFP